MIQDSGSRTEFETGAVRDMSEGKGDMVSCRGVRFCGFPAIMRTVRKSTDDSIIRKAYRYRPLSIPHAGILRSTNADATTRTTLQPRHSMCSALC